MSEHDSSGAAPPERRAPRADADVEGWLTAQALETAAPAVLIEGLAARLRAEGRPVERLHVAYSLLHPLFEAESLTWTPEGGLAQVGHDFRESAQRESWMKSPVRHVVANYVDEMRRRIETPAERAGFPMLDALAADGFTDYVILRQGFDAFTSYAPERDPESQSSGMVFALATRRPGGFSEADLAAFRALRAPFALALKVGVQDRVARALAACYIGPEAGRRVLEGSIHRGDGAVTPAVVAFFDMRDSTRLADSLPRERYIATLNRFFDIVAEAVHAAGGEVVAFLGDGALAIFAVARFGEAGARRAALEAATHAFASAAGRAEDAPELRFGAALHAGDVSYGNIGAPDRLVWSVIGPVVNETARIQELTRDYGEPLLASAAFLGEELAGWRRIAEARLRGVSRPLMVYTPAES